MFSQKSGIEKSIAAIIIPLVIQFVIQKVTSAGGKKSLENITSTLSDLGSTNINADDALVKQIQEKTKIKDSQQVTGYIQQAAGAIKQEVDANPKGIESLFSEVLGGTAGAAGTTAGAAKGLGERIKGFFGFK
jgi:hypothetical protein